MNKSCQIRRRHSDVAFLVFIRNSYFAIIAVTIALLYIEQVKSEDRKNQSLKELEVFDV